MHSRKIQQPNKQARRAERDHDHQLLFDFYVDFYLLNMSKAKFGYTFVDAKHCGLGDLLNSSAGLKACL